MLWSESFGSALRVLNLIYLFVICIWYLYGMLVQKSPAQSLAKFTLPVLSCATIVQKVTHKSTFSLCDVSQDS
jgi:uncharacterized protein with PQ loop repeat